QRAAYAESREILGLEPLPLQADYAGILASKETWLACDGDRPVAALIVEVEGEALLIWSIAVDPARQRSGLGRALLAAAGERAAALRIPTIRLYTGETLTHLVAWYRRHGFALERVEALADRRIVHLSKPVGPARGQ